MGFRTVVINSRCKLEFKLNYLVCRAEETKRIFIDEISTLIIHSTAVALTTSLLNELIKRNIKVIVCDEKHNPLAEFLPYHGSYNNALKIKQQIAWDNLTKMQVWTKIVNLKIVNQGKFLLKLGFEKEANTMFTYAENLQLNDSTNREGHSAKLYFASLFSVSWKRDGGDFYSKALNYGYTILLSFFNREIAKLGYLTQLGIWHENQFNDFNFACDLMEPFRVVVDNIVVRLEKDDINFKSKLIEMSEQKVLIDGKLMYLENAIEIYTRSVINALNSNDVDKILNYEL